MEYDKIIIGAGIYGLYSALFCAKNNEKVLVLEKDDESFKRATYINQARVHMGYHYPRSYSTAIKSKGYFERFNKDFEFSILSEFEQIYATSTNFSWTNAEEFRKFCKSANIMCDNVPIDKYFKDGMCDGAFLTKEYTYDAKILNQYFIEKLREYPNVEIKYNAEIDTIQKSGKYYEIELKTKEKYKTGFLLNCTYAGVNEIIEKLQYEKFKIKYELCEIILCEPSKALEGIGITVMDGPFFSIMPFGKTGLHSLTSVTFTPHVTSYDRTPVFACQRQLAEREGAVLCSQSKLDNCNDCPCRPKSAWPYMSHLADKYLREEYSYTYQGSLYSMKPILKSSEVDDSRPTAIRVLSSDPFFISVLSGKINTVYDLDEYLSLKGTVDGQR